MIWRAAILAMLAAGPSFAQQSVDGASARQMLFSERRSEMQIFLHPALGEDGLAALQSQQEALLASIPYYGAVAMSPADGLGAETTVASGNFHDIPAARAAVLAACDARRAAGTPACVVVLEVRPRGWEQRALQLSQGATAYFRREYGRGRGERAFAISATSGGFGVGKGAGAAASAIAACNAATGAGDCRVTIAD